MKDFAIKIDDLHLDKFTQDIRVLKVKLWYHFSEKLLRKLRTIENDHELLDVNLSIYSQPKIQCIFQMQEI